MAKPAEEGGIPKMAIITPAISGEFIRNVKLAPAPRRTRAVTDEPPIELKAAEAQSLVVGSGLIVAAENVPVQTREDLVNCTLFAQLAATGAVGNATKVREWYDAYFRTLTVLGWAQSDTQFEDYEFSSKNVEAHKAILQVLTVLLGPHAAALVVVKTAIEALQSMVDNSPWVRLFDRESKTGTSARFQVATAQVDASKLLQTALVGFDLKTRSQLTQVLFFKFSSSSTSLKYAAGKATIYEGALQQQREAIEGRLAAYRAAYIGQVTFPPPTGGAARSLRAPKKVGALDLRPSQVAKELLR